jgi:hypothetical protein
MYSPGIPMYRQQKNVELLSLHDLLSQLLSINIFVSLSLSLSLSLTHTHTHTNTHTHTHTIDFCSLENSDYYCATPRLKTATTYPALFFENPGN